MGIFSKDKEGGMVDVIRCDEQDYLIHKWRPSGEANSTSKENAIRWGSSLRVKDGEVAVFVYKQADGDKQDFIEGPHDEILKTKNFPVISSILGLAYAGKSPFQAEVYFINLAGIIQMKFAVPYFDVFDPRCPDFAAPIAARGSVTFNITDCQAFVQLHRMVNFDLEQFKGQVTDALTKFVKGIITNIPEEEDIPVLQLERKILQINDLIEPRIRQVLGDDFGVNLKRFDLSALEVDKESEEYEKLVLVTRQQQEKKTVAQTDVGIKDLEDTQEIDAESKKELQQMQREEWQRAQKLETEKKNLTAHQLNLQADVGKAAAEGMGKMGSGGGAGGSLDAGGLMAGMAMGGAVGKGMSGLVGGMMAGLSTPGESPQAAPPPIPTVQYMIVVNDQQAGPYNLKELGEFAMSGEFTKETLVWRQGMAEWLPSSKVSELESVFNMTPPPIPPPSPPQA